MEGINEKYPVLSINNNVGIDRWCPEYPDQVVGKENRQHALTPEHLPPQKQALRKEEQVKAVGHETLEVQEKRATRQL
ncbi:hypothetical protein CDAR_396071 [Caerostris darwini]|uniref:Uncharacterized protein n=1 Tax=Caerostris darwini TaxID=1538125 RepID=A0AAV4WP05_9ARAC|nr:hypothetical protein CDAR_396071 [Caerostris darwini]